MSETQCYWMTLHEVISFKSGFYVSVLSGPILIGQRTFDKLDIDQ